jgi:hypothetical protein
MIAELEKRNGNIIAPNDMKQSRTSSIPGRKKSQLASLPEITTHSYQYEVPELTFNALK